MFRRMPFYLLVGIHFFVFSCASRQSAQTFLPLQTSPSTRPASSLGHPLTDSHFHVRNYVQKGITLNQAYDILRQEGVERAAVFGIPLQQRWDMETQVAPSYYLHDDQALYYYSAIDAMVAVEYQSLSKKKRAAFDPMIVGFNPTDGWAVDHIRNMLLKFPGTFTGLGEFSIKKEVVSGKIAGGAANIEDPALGKVLDFAQEAGLVVILHCDVDAMISHNKEGPTFLKSLEKLFKKYKNTKIIWAHTGLGRYVKARNGHARWVGKLLSTYPNLFVDISWDVVAKQFLRKGKLRPQWKQFLQEHSLKILFGSDVVAPTPVKYRVTLNLYQKIWKELPQSTVRRITYGNYKRLFDEARLKVRRWEKKNLTIQ